MSDLRVHRVGSKVNLPRPRNRALVDENLLEKPRIVQWRKNTGKFFLL